MQRILCLSFLLMISQLNLKAQVILPKIEQGVKIERLSDVSEESNIFTYNKGENIFFYRTYVKGEGNDMEVLRQNIWFSSRENDKWTKPDRLFRMEDNVVENIIIGSSENGSKVYIFKTIYHATEDRLERKIGYLEKVDNDWGDYTEISIPGLVLGENYYHFHLSHDEKILMMSMSPNDQLLDEDIFVSIKKEDGSWGEIIDLGPTINTKRVEISPYIDNDGRTLYFSSEGHGGFGGSDVFVSYRLDDTWTYWTKPKNLGEAINTADYEENFVHTRNNEYYYTSDKDSKSADIYYSFSDYAVDLNRGNALVMKMGMPLGIPIKVYDDQGIAYESLTSGEDGKFKFRIKENVESLSFSSDDIHAKGAFIYTLDENGNKRERRIIGDDLKSFPEIELKKEQKVIGSLQAEGEALINTAIEVYDVNDYLIEKILTDENGLFTIQTDVIDQKLKIVPSTDKDWKLNSVQLYGIDGQFKNHLEPNAGLVDKDNRISEDKLAKNNVPVKNVTAPKATPSKPTPNTNKSSEFTDIVYFEFNAISLSKAESRKLRSVVSYLKKNPSAKITVIGNTDSEGENNLNMSIGEKRALYVKRSLVIEGVSSERITVESKGKSNPIASNENENGRSKNRRVEIQLQ